VDEQNEKTVDEQNVTTVPTNGTNTTRK
jgi:hypothetical protein